MKWDLWDSGAQRRVPLDVSFLEKDAMPFYYRIDEATPDGRRTAETLLRLRGQLDTELPARNLSDTLLLATWNLREFDSAKYGPRLPEALYYIAEIISRFDLVAVQEVREDLAALKGLMRILGGWWNYLVTDLTEGSSGNYERLAFVFDRRKISFSGLAGEAVMPPTKAKTPAEQLARTPYIVGFQAGWFKFALCTVHIIYGEGKAVPPARLKEIDSIASFLAKRAGNLAKQHEAEHLLLLGDFNIFATTDATLKAIEKAGFCIPPELQSIEGTNVDHKKHYDQIAYFPVEQKIGFTGKAGVFDFYDSVFRLGTDDATYLPAARANYERAKKKTLAPDRWPGKGFREWRTYQMSDHLPMWVELKIDFGQEYLQAKAAGR